MKKKMQQAKNERELIFNTPGAIRTKYSVYIETESQRHEFHLFGVHSPEEALGLSLGEYVSTARSLSGITDISVVGYFQTKKEREQGVAYADLHFPPVPLSK